MKTLGLSLLATTLLAGACAAQDDEPNYDEAQLATYRSALPTRARLEAGQATASTATLLGEAAVYPDAAGDIIVGINGTVGLTVDLLDLITSLPPTVYNSETNEFFWGPYADDDFGYGAAYIREAAPGADFQYEYAFLRGASNDLASLTAIVYGGATPDPLNDDHGVGVTVWDMTAADAFSAEYDPNYDAAEAESGRFAALFAAGPDEDNPANTVTAVVAVFRDAIFKDSEDGLPVDLDYFYGHVANAQNTFDFVDIESEFDISEPTDGVAERIGIRMAFVDGGVGRAEADAIGGSLENGQSYDVVECWDTSINQTFISGNVSENGSSTEVHALGEPEDCGAFNMSLDDLGVPRLQDVDADLLAALDNAASNGL
tara:strand:+ start:14727 stop:15848 length:1122 start_codon:yes stop_codon:yes gene_type:complete